MSIGCHRTTAPTAIIVKIDNLGERNKSDITNRRISIVATVESDWASCIPLLISKDTGSPPVKREFETPSTLKVLQSRAEIHPSPVK